jgi:Tol biopolymer transport system component
VAVLAYLNRVGLVCVACLLLACGAGAGVSSGVASAATGRACPLQLAFADGRIKVLDLASGRVRQLTHAGARWEDGHPAWSPHGGRIAFDRIDTASNSFFVQADVYIARADGSALRRRIGEAWFPAWSPSGKQLMVYTAGGHDSILAILDAEGSDQREAFVYATEGAWAPDGRTIAVPFRAGLELVNAYGKELRMVARGTFRHPAWSPDGRRIAFDASGDIAVIAPDGTGRRLLVRGGSSAAWSPDGRRLAFVTTKGLSVVNADGSGRRVLTRARRLQSAAWSSPGGRWIAFVRGWQSGSDGSVGVVRPDGTGARVLPIHSDGVVAWRPCK